MTPCCENVTVLGAARQLLVSAQERLVNDPAQAEGSFAEALAALADVAGDEASRLRVCLGRVHSNQI